MDFAMDATTTEWVGRVRDFLDECVYPVEPVFADQVAALENPWDRPPVVEELKAEARRRGLWNLFLPDKAHGAGLTNLQYAPLAELSGRSPALAPEAMNCAAPDTGNMELLAAFGTPAQQKEWLQPLLDGQIRSAFCMTEPEVASSDAANIATRIERDGDHYVINGRKWWSSGGMSPRCQILVVMGKTDPAAEPRQQQSMVLVPRDTPGVQVRRGMEVFGYTHGPHGGHAEIAFHDVRVPVDNLLGGEGRGFAIAQARPRSPRGGGTSPAGGAGGRGGRGSPAPRWPAANCAPTGKWRTCSSRRARCGCAPRRAPDRPAAWRYPPPPRCPRRGWRRRSGRPRRTRGAPAAGCETPAASRRRSDRPRTAARARRPARSRRTRPRYRWAGTR